MQLVETNFNPTLTFTALRQGAGGGGGETKDTSLIFLICCQAPLQWLTGPNFYATRLNKSFAIFPRKYASMLYDPRL